MTEGEALQLAGLMGLLWRGQDVPRETALLWCEAGLGDIELRHAVAAVKELAKSSSFLPTLAELREAAGRANRRERESRPHLLEPPGVLPPPDLRADLIRQGIFAPDPPAPTHAEESA